jgi:hypothetical protein
MQKTFSRVLRCKGNQHSESDDFTSALTISMFVVARCRFSHQAKTIFQAAIELLE